MINKNKVKRLIKKNKYTHAVARKAKVILSPQSFINHEIYEFERYYPSVSELELQVRGYKNFKYCPTISVVVPTYNTNEKFLRECIESVVKQSYPNWELSIADDASPNKNVIQIIKEYQKVDRRIKLTARGSNGHISVASNSAINNASGEFIALLDHDDVLWPNALFEIVKKINENPDADLIYTDEDKIDTNSRVHSYPFFKPNWSPEFLESCNYITHFSCIRREIVEKIGGFRKGYEGAQDWDMFIRVAEITEHIYHIPKVLYSWRVHEASTAQDTDAKPYVYEAQKKLLEDHIQRMGKKGEVNVGLIWQHSVIEYEVEGDPKVGILFDGDKPTKEIVNRLKNAGYDRFEIICVGKNYKNIKAVLNNPKADYYLIYPSGFEIVSKNWLNLLLADAQIEGVGVVGGRIVDERKEEIISAGVAFGLGKGQATLLQGYPIDDNHYMRALYGKSRRNISAVNGPIILKSEVLSKINNLQLDFSNSVEVCLAVLSEGFRNIYSPYVSSIIMPNNNRSVLQKLTARNWSMYLKNDPYINPNYNKASGNLEI